MLGSVKRVLAVTAALAFVFAALGAETAHAQKAKPKRTQGQFVSFDPNTNTIVVKEKGKDNTYTVKPEGSILTRTAVKVNGLGAKVSELKEGTRIILYWVPDEKDPKQRFARTIDAPNVPEDLEEEFDR